MAGGRETGSLARRLLKLPLRLGGWLARRAIGLVLVVVLALGLDIATLTIPAAFSAASAALSFAGLRTVAPDPRETRRATRAIASRLRKRTARLAVLNVTGSAAEAIPMAGIAVIVGLTAYEAKAACDTMRDLDELEREVLGEADGSEAGHVCGMEVPTAGDLWRRAFGDRAAVERELDEAVAEIPEAAEELERARADRAPQ